MSLTLEQKQSVVAEVSEVAANAESAIAAEYIGLTVSQMTELRSKAREKGVYVRVVKNSLARRAIEGTGFECLNDSLKGPLLLIHGMEDPNVLFQDTVRVYRELLKAGKGPLVELFLDPTGGHGLGGDVNTLNRMKKYEAFLLQHVKKAK